MEFTKRTLAAVGALVCVVHVHAQLPSLPIRRRVSDVSFIGQFALPSSTYFQDTRFGGISGLAYNPTEQVVYAVSDDEESPRFYSLEFNFNDITPNILGVTTLLNEIGGTHFDAPIDAEGIAFSDGSLYVASGGAAASSVPPGVLEFDTSGVQQGNQFTIPDVFLPAPGRGIQSSQGFDSMTITPNGKTLWTAVESPLTQDGGNLVRMLSFDVADRYNAKSQVVYLTDDDSGLVDLVATDDDGSFLALERSGDTVKLYEAWAQGALDVTGIPDLFWEAEGIPFEMDPPVQKRLIADLTADLGATLDNYEGMTLVATTGGYVLLLVSDNDFEDGKGTRFVGLTVAFDSFGLATPALETPGAVDENPELAASLGLVAGDSDDPAIWLHPTDPSLSLVVVTLKDGGMIVLDLEGKILQEIFPPEYGENRYNNVDILYAYETPSGALVDLAIASDRQLDTIAVWRIDPETRYLVDVTSASVPETIFGVDDGDATAYGLTTYSSLVDGTDYVFVTQSDGNLVAQLQLMTDPADGKVSAEVVRMIELPIEEGGEPGDSQSEGVVVDRNAADLYIAIEDASFGILKFDAEPDGGSFFTQVAEIDEEILYPDVEGLTIYYNGFFGEGYLVASSQGDSSFAVYDLMTNDYIASFGVGDNGHIDQANECDGAHVLNSYLGPDFPCGLLVVQDGANDPQVAVEDDEELENASTNFKFVPWENVAAAIPSGLAIEPLKWGPRRHALELRSASIIRAIMAAADSGTIATSIAETLTSLLVVANIRLLEGSSAPPYMSRDRIRRRMNEIRHGSRRRERGSPIQPRNGLKGARGRNLQAEDRKGKKESKNKKMNDKDDEEEPEGVCGQAMVGDGASGAVRDALQTFVGTVEELVAADYAIPAELGAQWTSKAHAIMDALPSYYF